MASRSSEQSRASNDALALGIDIGTSGVRAIVLDTSEQVRGTARRAWSDAAVARSPDAWWVGTAEVIEAALASCERDAVQVVCIDGTSGSLLAVDAAGAPIAPPLMYSDAVDDSSLLARIATHMPATSAAGGVSSGLAKALVFARLSPHRILHQADWIASRLTGRLDLSDANNALKTGYDPVAGCWPDWIEAAGMQRDLLPRVLVPGSIAAPLLPTVCARFGLSSNTRLVAGTTDGCAAFLATGASEPGDAVTSLGSTITLKILSDRPHVAPEYGLYSHRIGSSWLAGGASNSGGAVLARHFDPDTLVALSARIDAETDSGLDYYPLNGVGERFPRADPRLAPRLEPRPDDDARFLHGLLEGMARIEAEGYARLAELGAPRPRTLRTVGGGATNPTWTRLRERMTGVAVADAISTDAAVGTARLALNALRESGAADRC